MAQAQKMPGIGGWGLPFDNDQEGGAIGNYDNDPFLRFIDAFVGYFIQTVAVFAVLALMFSGIMLIVSGGEEEKLKKAKTWFIWSLVGVFISLTAWFMISYLNNLRIGR